MDHERRYAHVCPKHNQTIQFIHVDLNQDNVLKCLDCLLQGKIQKEQMLPFESVLKEIHQIPNWIFESEKQFNTLYSEYSQGQKQFSAELQEFQSVFETFKVALLQRIDSSSQQIQNMILQQQQQKVQYISSYIASTRLDQLQRVIADRECIDPDALNQSIKTVIHQAQSNYGTGKKELLNISEQITKFNISSTYHKLCEQLSDIVKLVDGDFKSVSADLLQNLGCNNNTNPTQNDQKKAKQNILPSREVTEIMKLISNKSNGCTNQFLEEVKSQLTQVQDKITLKLWDIYQNKDFPLKYDQITEQQFQEMAKYTANPNKYTFTDVDNMPCKQNNKMLLGYQTTKYLQSQNMKIDSEKNSIIIKNRQQQGQAVSKRSLDKDKDYSFTISFNKPFMRNRLFFGLILPQQANIKSISSQNLGFSFSDLSKNEPTLLYGTSFNERSTENFQLEVKINLKLKQMIVFSSPDYQTAYLIKLSNAYDEQQYNFGVEFQTEQNFIVSIF